MQTNTNSPTGAAPPLPPPNRKLLPVKRLTERNPGLSEGGVRWDLFQRRTNGLEDSGAVIYRGRNILLDEDIYLDWLARRGGRPAA